MIYAWVENGNIFAVEKLEDIPDQYKNLYIVIDDVPIHLLLQYYYVENNQIKRRDINQLIQEKRKEKITELNRKYYEVVHQYLELNIDNRSVNELIELDKQLRTQYNQLKNMILNSNDINELLSITINFQVT